MDLLSIKMPLAIEEMGLECKLLPQKDIDVLLNVLLYFLIVLQLNPFQRLLQLLT